MLTVDGMMPIDAVCARSDMLSRVVCLFEEALITTRPVRRTNQGCSSSLSRLSSSGAIITSYSHRT